MMSAGRVIVKSSKKIKRAGKPHKREGANDHADIAPPVEQMGEGDFELQDITEKSLSGRMVKLGKAWCRVPMLLKLHRQGYFTDREYKALDKYRHMAAMASKSPIKDSLRIEPYGGSGNGPTNELLSAIEVVRDCEAAAGQLRDILIAVVLGDKSLSQWAGEQGGWIQDGGRVKPKQNFLKIAQLEIKMVAKRVEAEMSA